MPMNSRLLRPLASRSLFDADAAAYLTAVQTADNQALEPAVRNAITAFVIGCKQDGIWSAIKASCILMGARTLSGAFTPLVGAAPTNVNFVSGDYNRKTGLLGNGSNKYVNSNRASNADPQNSVHLSVYVAAVAPSITRALIGDTAFSNGQTILSASVDGTLVTRARATSADPGPTVAGEGNTNGFKAVTRAVSTEFVRRAGSVSQTVSMASGAPTSENYAVFARTPSSPALFSSDRLAYYSLGESLDLALLDTRVSALYNAIGAAIP